MLGAREYRDPAPFLRRLKTLESQLFGMSIDQEVRQLRTNGLKEWREARTASLFCYGMGQRLGQTVYVSKGEFEDADFVACWARGDEQHFAPVQLKEVVPIERNETSDFDQVLADLNKYSSPGLTVVLHLNRRLRFDPSTVRIPALCIASLWVLGCVSQDGAEWALWGDLLSGGEESRFAYPV